MSRSVWADFLTDDPTSWKVRVGEHNMNEDDDTQMDINIDRIIFHPERNRRCFLVPVRYSRGPLFWGLLAVIRI
jgi:Trypsin